MGFLSRFEGKVEDTFDNAAGKMFDAPISPVQIAKKAEKQMRREKMVGAGKQYAPTLYTVLVNPDDDERLFGYYPTLAGETETYLAAKADEDGLVMDGQPLVRFIVDEDLKHGKFDIIAETVAAPIVDQLREEEMQRYGIAPQSSRRASAYAAPRRSEAREAYAQPASSAYANAYNDPYAPRDSFAQQGGYNDFNSFQNAWESPNAAAGAQAQPIPNASFEPTPEPIPQPTPLPQAQPIPNAMAAGAAGVGSAEAALGAGAVSAGAGFAAGAGAAALGASAQAAAPHAAEDAYAAPNTVMFAGGSANPVPSQQAVQAQLVDLTNGTTYALASSRLLIGRESSCNIVLPDINASRTHAELRREGQGMWVLSDLGSTNGTTVNGVSITTAPLYDGDRITIGMTNLQFSQR